MNCVQKKLIEFLSFFWIIEIAVIDLVLWKIIEFVRNCKGFVRVLGKFEDWLETFEDIFEDILSSTCKFPGLKFRTNFLEISRSQTLIMSPNICLGRPGIRLLKVHRVAIQHKFHLFAKSSQFLRS